ncbi:MAG: hypothetical protein E7624_00390 [Ruminococcaceae bacterium]|nr:hypothetical protein [Oscillospiraceae bacterium]
MKKWMIFWLSLALLLPSCRRAEAAGGSLDILVTRVQNAISSEEDFVIADADFTVDHFGEPTFLQDAIVALGNGKKTREFGLFRLKDRTKAAELKASVRQYLKGEQEALISLSALYPTEELEARLALYQNATVGSEGMLVYYFVLDKKETKLAIEALTGR